MYCSHCGKFVEDGSKFCGACGASTGAAAASAGSRASVPPRSTGSGFHAPEQFSSEPRPVAPARRTYEQPQPTTAPRSYEQPKPTYAPPRSYEQPQSTYAPPRSYERPQPDYAQPQPAYGTTVINNNITYQAYQSPASHLSTNRGLVKFFFLNLVTLGIYGIVFFTNISTSLNTAASRYDGRKTMNYCLVYFIFSWLTLGIVPLVWFSKMSGRVGNELRRRGIYYSFGAGTFWLWCILGALITVGPFIYIHKLSKAMNKICEDYNVKG